MIVSCYGISTEGRVKEVNQDSIFYKVTPDNNAGVFVVADGVGGLASGEVAARIATQEVENHWIDLMRACSANDTQVVVDALSELIFFINGKIQAFNIEAEKKSATTFSLLLVYFNRYYIAHVGDSRIYTVDTSRGRPFALLRATRDHSKEVLRERNGRQFMQSMLTDGLGYRKGIRWDCSYGVVDEETGSFIICSDGIYKRQSDELICEIVDGNGFDPERVCGELVNNAMRLGESDNISAIFVNVSNAHSV